MAQHHPPRSHAIHSRVRSFSRAGGRLRPVQAEALAELGPRYVVDVPRADAVRTVSPSFRLEPEKVFGHVGQVRPLIVEVGPGSGEALLAHAAAHPGADYLAVEVWETAIARLVTSIHRRGLHNVRVVPADASQLLATALPVSCASEVWVFFPDPWRKPRHRKRRLVTTAFADSVARCCVPAGCGAWPPTGRTTPGRCATSSRTWRRCPPVSARTPPCPTSGTTTPVPDPTWGRRPPRRTVWATAWTRDRPRGCVADGRPVTRGGS